MAESRSTPFDLSLAIHTSILNPDLYKIQALATWSTARAHLARGSTCTRTPCTLCSVDRTSAWLATGKDHTRRDGR